MLLEISIADHGFLNIKGNEGHTMITLFVFLHTYSNPSSVHIYAHTHKIQGFYLYEIV